MHLAHIVTFTLRPASTMETFCRFGRKVRLVARFEKLTLCPKTVVLPQLLHLAMSVVVQ